MANKIIETTHDYEPVNKYIDEKARIKRTRSVWTQTIEPQRKVWINDLTKKST